MLICEHCGGNILETEEFGVEEHCESCDLSIFASANDIINQYRNIPLSYNDKVFGWLIYELQEGESKEIRYLASPATRDKFLSSVIMFIQHYQELYGCVIEVSDDRKSIRKQKIYIPTNKQPL